ncbi:MAG: c-type cytochrome, partial [Novosphingobium sp.]|nr:c-type cytochrome [Novosphingobium sp.]
MAGVLKTLRPVLLAAALAGSGPALAGDKSGGAKVFQAQCSICHHDTKNAPPSAGPDLYGVVGRKAGSLKGYEFSTAMKHSGLTWTPDELRRYLADPGKVVPGNKMPFPGMHDSARLDAVLSYLET